MAGLWMRICRACVFQSHSNINVQCTWLSEPQQICHLIFVLNVGMQPRRPSVDYTFSWIETHENKNPSNIMRDPRCLATHCNPSRIKLPNDESIGGKQANKRRRRIVDPAREVSKIKHSWMIWKFSSCSHWHGIHVAWVYVFLCVQRQAAKLNMGAHTTHKMDEEERRDWKNEEEIQCNRRNMQHGSSNNRKMETRTKPIIPSSLCRCCLLLLLLIVVEIVLFLFSLSFCWFFYQTEWVASRKKSSWRRKRLSWMRSGNKGADH